MRVCSIHAAGRWFSLLCVAFCFYRLLPESVMCRLLGLFFFVYLLHPYSSAWLVLRVRLLQRAGFWDVLFLLRGLVATRGQLRGGRWNSARENARGFRRRKKKRLCKNNYAVEGTNEKTRSAG